MVNVSHMHYASGQKYIEIIIFEWKLIENEIII
jgi:hypothetical protein